MNYLDVALALFYVGGLSAVLGALAFAADWLDRRFPW